MKRGLKEALGVAAGFTAVTFLVTAFDGASAQESEAHEEHHTPAPMISMIGGTGAYLGIEIADVDSDVMDEEGLSEEYGVYVERVVEEGPAAEAGLKDGDVLVRWNGDRLESVAQLQRLLRETPAGRTVSLGVMRDGASREVSVELGDRATNDLHVFTVPRDRSVFMRERNREAGDRIRDRIRDSFRFTPRGDLDIRTFGGRPRLGVSVQSMGEQLAEYFGVDGGALVTDVQDDSPAAKAGIRAGDVIVEIEGESVDEPGDLMKVLSDQEAGPVEVEVVRDGDRRSFTVEIEEREDGEPGFAEGAASFSLAPFSVEIPSIEMPSFDIPSLEVPAVGVRTIRV